eukprot:CAMPEP_0194728082 /NCGR_PEP_ID=MMETSP0296-20130528/37285_1 /TAXON_ID=39354 /ORGANISM="Heterosigma akashiwo, Strain CCMP2393" /LENGTH=30 /DNA_ID= /DNA_START= /DNA_END= /DNA_ORIENTATION=
MCISKLGEQLGSVPRSTSTVSPPAADPGPG